MGITAGRAEPTGIDYAVGSLVAGIALSRSVGEGSYRNGRGSGNGYLSIRGQ